MCIGDHFHGEMGFTIGQATTDRGPNAGSLFWVQGIHIKAKVDAIIVRSRDGQGFAHDFGDTALINIGHREDMNGVGVQALSFRWIQVAHANDDDAISMDFRGPSTDTGQVFITYACQRSQYQPVDIAGWRCLIGIKISVGVNPEHAYIFVYPGHAGNRAKGNAMISSYDEREFVFLQRVCDNISQFVTNLYDGFEVLYFEVT